MNPLALDTIYARRPALAYVSPAICEAVFSSSSFPSLILDAVDPRNRNRVTGMVVTYTGGGDYLINFNNYPGALCYSVYKLNDATDPFSGYVIIAECITDTEFDPNDWIFPKPIPGIPQCFVFTALTPDGETEFSDTICVFTPEDPDDPPLPGTGCILNANPLPDGNVGVEYTPVTLLPNGPADVPQWTIWSGELPPGLSLNIDSGVISGTPTEEGIFDFQVLLTKNGGGSCRKAFTITVTGGCTSTITYFGGLSGVQVLGSGENAVLAEADIDPNIEPPFWSGYTQLNSANGTAAICTINVNWDPSETNLWFLNCIYGFGVSESEAQGSFQSAFDNSQNKTVKVPVYPANDITTLYEMFQPAGGQGDATVTCSVECVGYNGIGTIAWDAPSIFESNAGTCSGSAAGNSFHAEGNAPSAPADDFQVILTGNWTLAENGWAGRLQIEASGSNWDDMLFQVQISIAGNVVWSTSSFGDKDEVGNDGVWLEDGTFMLPIVFPGTIGDLVEIEVTLATGGLGLGSIDVTGTLVPFA